MSGDGSLLHPWASFSVLAGSSVFPPNAHAVVKPVNSLAKLRNAVAHGAAPGQPKAPGKSGVSLIMKEGGDRMDKDFERF